MNVALTIQGHYIHYHTVRRHFRSTRITFAHVTMSSSVPWPGEMTSIVTSSDGGQTNADKASSAPVVGDPSISTTNCRRLTLGVIIVICIALSWVGAVQTTKVSYNGGFSAPMFLVWFGTAWMMTLFPFASAMYFLTVPHRHRNWDEYWR